MTEDQIVQLQAEVALSQPSFEDLADAVADLASMVDPDYYDEKTVEIVKWLKKSRRLQWHTARWIKAHRRVVKPAELRFR